MDKNPGKPISEVIEDNTAEYFLYLGHINGSEICDRPDIKYILTGCMHNRILRARFSGTEADEVVRAIMRRLKALDIPALWMLNPEASAPELPGVLLRHGFTYLKDWKSMALDLPSAKVEGIDTDGLEIREAVSTDDLAAWSDVLLASFDIDPDISNAYGKYLISQDEINGVMQYHFLGLLDGYPVASAVLFKGKEAAGIYWVGTLPQARRRGIGAAMMRHVLCKAKASGYSLATLNASNAGHPLYRKLGFVDYFSTNIYSWCPK